MDTIKALHIGRRADAEEWAMRQGMAIASKYFENVEDTTTMFALAADVAEALTGVRRACNQGLM